MHSRERLLLLLLVDYVIELTYETQRYVRREIMALSENDQENAGSEKWRTKSQGWKIQDQVILHAAVYVSSISSNNRPISNSICNLWCSQVRHFPGPAFSSCCYFVVRHFQILQI